MQKIIPHLWFDKEAKEAAEFYTSIFSANLKQEIVSLGEENLDYKNSTKSKIMSTSTLENTPSGTVETVTIELYGQKFVLLSAGPYFKFTPAVSFLVACKTKEEVDMLWEKLSKGGNTLMEFGKYPFSERYGWTEDKYGLSWQIMLIGDQKINQKITPTLMFVGKQYGKAEEAINFYTSVFQKHFHSVKKDSKVFDIFRYGKGEEPDREGTIKNASFTLEGQYFSAMDSALEHKFTFNEAISFIVNCDTQEEIDYYWKKLSADPGSEQCGWLKDKYGLSWQIVPKELNKMLEGKDKERIARVTEAFLKMKKFNIVDLKNVYDGNQ